MQKYKLLTILLQSIFGKLNNKYSKKLIVLDFRYWIFFKLTASLRVQRCDLKCQGQHANVDRAIRS